METVGTLKAFRVIESPKVPKVSWGFPSARKQRVHVESALKPTKANKSCHVLLALSVTPKSPQTLKGTSDVLLAYYTTY
jgi:hypothetical protein